MGAAGAIAALSLVGAGYSAYSQYKQAGAEQDAAEDAADFNARVLAEQAAIEEDRKRRIAKRELASQRTAYAKAGVRLEGSPLEVLVANAAELEREIFNLRVEGARRVDYQMLQRKAAGATGRAKRVAAGASLLSGTAGSAGTYGQLSGKF